MRFEGVVITDTHQQEAELAVLELTVTGDEVAGRFATVMDSQTGFYVTGAGYRDFRGRVTARSGPDRFSAVLAGRFNCHFFDAQEILLEVDGGRARIAQTPGGPAVTLRRKD